MPVAEYAEYGEIVDIQPLAYTDDPRGPSYGKTWRPSGAPFKGLPLKVSAREAFSLGKESTTVTYRILCDPPLAVDEKSRVEVPGVGTLDVFNAVSYPSEQLAILYAEATS